ncbi:hypothetical protein b3_0252 [Synechococcus phage B3]|nr:hypothetical protein b3_0252 [Synechococcus phage B3]
MTEWLWVLYSQPFLFVIVYIIKGQEKCPDLYDCGLPLS